MAINNNITRIDLAQSQIFKNILGAGLNMASFLGKAAIADEQKNLAASLIKDWNDACKAFAENNENPWEEARYKEIINDIAENLAKAKAMTEMALEADLMKISADTLHGYFWELSSLISVIETVFDELC